VLYRRPEPKGRLRVATKTGTCGQTTVDYDERCIWLCVCFPGKPCNWSTTCPGPDGKDIKTTGTGLEIQPPDDDDEGPTHIGFDGPADAFAMLVGERTGRRIEVPEHIAGQRITIDVDGGWDAALRAAGFAGEATPLPRGVSVRGGRATIDSSVPAALVAAPDGGSVVVVLTAAARGTSGWGLGLVVRCDCKGIQGWCDTTLIDIGGGNSEVQCVSHGCTLTCEQSFKTGGTKLWARSGWTALSELPDVGPVDR
jgi:hypothetical protein